MQAKICSIVLPIKEVLACEAMLARRLTPMTAGDLFVQMPRHTLNRICVRRVGEQVMEEQAMAPSAEITSHGLADGYEHCHR